MKILVYSRTLLRRVWYYYCFLFNESFESWDYCYMFVFFGMVDSIGLLCMIYDILLLFWIIGLVILCYEISFCFVLAVLSC